MIYLPIVALYIASACWSLARSYHLVQKMMTSYGGRRPPKSKPEASRSETDSRKRDLEMRYRTIESSIDHYQGNAVVSGQSTPRKNSTQIPNHSDTIPIHPVSKTQANTPKKMPSEGQTKYQHTMSSQTQQCRHVSFPPSRFPRRDLPTPVAPRCERIEDIQKANIAQTDLRR